MTCTLSLPLTTSEGKVKSKVFDTARGLLPVKSKRSVWEYVCSNPSAYQKKKNREDYCNFQRFAAFWIGTICLQCWDTWSSVRYFALLHNTSRTWAIGLSEVTQRNYKNLPPLFASRDHMLIIKICLQNQRKHFWFQWAQCQAQSSPWPSILQGQK